MRGKIILPRFFVIGITCFADIENASLGVDLDRCTLLHTAEELADCPFLEEKTSYYLDQEGKRKKKVLKKYPGPHRNFIGLDRLFRRAGLIRVGRVGKAVTRLIKASDLIRETTKILQENPAAVLCDNPSCQDCLKQKSSILFNILQREQFKLAALISETKFTEDSLALLSYYGVKNIELTDELTGKLLNDKHYFAAFQQKVKTTELKVAGLGITTSIAALTCEKPTGLACKLREKAELLGARFVRIRLTESSDPTENETVLLESIKILASFFGEQKLELLLVNDPQGPLADYAQIEQLFLQLKAEKLEEVKFGFSPEGFVEIGKKPFLEVFYQSLIPKVINNLYLVDCRFKDGCLTLLALGNGELKELISALRCRSYEGFFTIGSFGADPFELEERLEDFWEKFSSL